MHSRRHLYSALILVAPLAAGASTQQAARVTATAQQGGTSNTLVAVSVVSERVAWASGRRGTFVRTVDGGATWVASQVPGAELLEFRDVHAVDANTAYLLSIGNGASSRIYKTTDGGASWTLQFTNADSSAFYDCVDFWDARRGIANSDAVKGATTIIATEDGGAHWTQIPPASLPPALDGEGSFASSGTCVTTQPGGHAWIGTTKGRVLRTADFGRTWHVARVPISIHDSVGVTSVSFRDALHGLAFGGFGANAGDSLIAITSDGGATWSSLPRPAIAGGVWAGAYVPGHASTVVVVGSTGSAWSGDEGKTWTAIDTAVYWGLAFAKNGVGWAVGANGRITKLTGF